MKKRQRVNSFNIDLSDAPAQNPIPKNGGRIGRGASKYTGVSFDKHAKKWIAQITIEGKQRRIGCYDNEVEAAVDYARALFLSTNGKRQETKRVKQTQHSWI